MSTANLPGSLRFPQRNIFWFQEEGFYDQERRQWVPFRPLPQELEEPGPLNLRDNRSDITESELESIIRRWHRVRWPRLTRAMRARYVEPRRRSLRRFTEVLWRRLTEIEGFDSASVRERYGVDDEFRLDRYGNVVGRNAERFSRTAWNIDHIFAYSRGGLSELGNLRIINERANIVVKGARIEQTIARKEMQVGVSEAAFRDAARNSAIDDFYAYMTRPLDEQRIECETSATLELAAERVDERRCDVCVEREAGHTCSHCRAAQYCSRECQRADWLELDHASRCR